MSFARIIKLLQLTVVLIKLKKNIKRTSAYNSTYTYINMTAFFPKQLNIYLLFNTAADHLGIEFT